VAQRRRSTIAPRTSLDRHCLDVLIAGTSPAVSTHSKLLRRILEGRSEANIAFDELRSLLRSLGFRETARGSDHVFRRPDVPERINLQADGGKVKVYQVRQVRRILVKDSLVGGE